MDNIKWEGRWTSVLGIKFRCVDGFGGIFWYQCENMVVVLRCKCNPQSIKYRLYCIIKKLRLLWKNIHKYYSLICTLSPISIYVYKMFCEYYILSNTHTYIYIFVNNVCNDLPNTGSMFIPWTEKERGWSKLYTDW